MRCAGAAGIVCLLYRNANRAGPPGALSPGNAARWSAARSWRETSAPADATLNNCLGAGCTLFAKPVDVDSLRETRNHLPCGREAGETSRRGGGEQQADGLQQPAEQLPRLEWARAPLLLAAAGVAQFWATSSLVVRSRCLLLAAVLMF
jgi:hypothetical protein